MYQLQSLEKPEAVEAVARSSYSLLVLEPTRTVKGNESFDIRGMVRKLHSLPNGKRRLLLAYLCVGEAEDYRSYWRKDWRKPTRAKRGKPDFIIAPDPDGWSGNYPVAFWDARWKKLWIGATGVVRQMAEAGFDGVYLDWVDAYEHPKVEQAARSQGLDPALEMIRFIEQIREEGGKINPGFLVIPQNAIYLLDKEPARYLAAIDGLGVEDTWFHGTADAPWGSPAGGDQPGDETAARLAQYRKYVQAGKPVFSIDYCLKSANAAKVYSAARKAGLRPLVTRMALSAITTFPPPGAK
jgi:cysteinyl-tRNA synthetase